MCSTSLKDVILDELVDDSVMLDIFESSSDEELDVCKLASTVIIQAALKRKRDTIKNYCDEVLNNYTAQEFASHFRVTKLLFHDLVRRFQESDIYKKLTDSANSRANISPEKHILIFLWFAGHQTIPHQTSSFRDVADRFDVCLSSLHDVLTRVMMFLSSLASVTITFPSEQEKLETKTFYERNQFFPNVVGSVGGCHIRIDKPSDCATDYVNGKDYHSIILQGVCNESLKFIDICVGYPGSVDYARVFRNSALHTKLNEFCSGEEYILGDCAYPLQTNLFTPYKDNGHLTKAQKNFNTKLNSCRVSIENAFALLKRRFRQLYHLKLKAPERLCHIIRACCVLHNLCIGDNLSFEDAVDDQPNLLICEGAVNREANKLRDNISKNLAFHVY